ncbi:MAG: hypothetical protein JNM76_07295 [Betaproteobacteria bacterium]|nr:hypothetical protein [Betaproteobacteria bacterium]
MSILANQMKSNWRPMVSVALLWAVFATLSHVRSSAGGAKVAPVSMRGFARFATGLWLFADGVKRDVVAELSRE